MKDFSDEVVSDMLRMVHENEWLPAIVAKIVGRIHGVEMCAKDVREIVKRRG